MDGWRVRYRDFNLKWSDWSNEFIINDTATTVKNINISKVSIAPNPTKNRVEVSYNISHSELVTAKVFNSIGNEVISLSENEIQNSGNHIYTIDFSEKYEQGIYYLNISFSGKMVSKKIVFVK